MKSLNLTKKNFNTRISIAIVCALLVGGLSLGAYACIAPHTYVSLDVNPSVEYTLNMFDRVLSVNAVNEDGASILQEVNLADFNNKTIDDAIKITLDEITAKGYFDGNAPGGIVIATSGKSTDTSEVLANHIKGVITTQCTANNQSVSVETVTANKAQIDEAKTLGVSAGKMLLVEELKEELPAGTEFDQAAWLSMPVKDIMAEIERLDELEDAQEDALDAQEDALDAEEDALDEAEEAEEDALDAQEEAADLEKELAEKAEDAAEKEAEALKEAADAKRDEEDEAQDLAKELEGD